MNHNFITIIEFDALRKELEGSLNKSKLYAKLNFLISRFKEITLTILARYVKNKGGPQVSFIKSLTRGPDGS